MEFSEDCQLNPVSPEFLSIFKKSPDNLRSRYNHSKVDHYMGADIIVHD